MRTLEPITATPDREMTVLTETPAGWEIHSKGLYPSDPGDGVRLEVTTDGRIEIGIFWDGNERMVTVVPADRVAELIGAVTDSRWSIHRWSHPRGGPS